MGVLLMIMSIGGLICAGILVAVSLLSRKAWLAKFAVGGVVIWSAFYTAMLVDYSLTSIERTIEIGDTDGKAFCGFYLDCHMHAAVTAVRTAEGLGGRDAKGTFYIVHIKVFSDAKNPSMSFRLVEPRAHIVLANGQMIERDLDAEELLPTAAVSLGADIKGHETIDKEIVFDVPAGTPDAKLLITEGYGVEKVIERVLIGDEDSFLHAQTFFKLPEQSAMPGVK